MSARQLPPPEDRQPEEEEALTIPEGFHDQRVPVTEGRDRRALATDVELNPASLSGSYFHRVENGEVVWAGVIVGEVQAGKYLCQIDQGLEGAGRSKVQVIVALEQMLAADPGYEWRFYDTEEARTLAYAEFLAAKERAS